MLFIIRRTIPVYSMKLTNFKEDTVSLYNNRINRNSQFYQKIREVFRK